MSIEAGARAGLIAPDETTFAYLSGRPLVPTGTAFDDAKAAWRALRSDAGAVYDKVVEIDAADIAPMVTWGTNPEAVVTIVDRVPDPDRLPDPDAASQARRRSAERRVGHECVSPCRSWGAPLTYKKQKTKI